jgi:hypothetical protein
MPALHGDHAKRSRVNPAAFVASMALIAQTLCACSGLPSTTSSAAPYANLNEPPPRRDPLADQEVARTKTELIATRDNLENAAARLQAPR